VFFSLPSTATSFTPDFLDETCPEESYLTIMAYERVEMDDLEMRMVGEWVWQNQIADEESSVFELQNDAVEGHGVPNWTDGWDYEAWMVRGECSIDDLNEYE
jgi:hypothetical protein